MSFSRRRSQFAPFGALHRIALGASIASLWVAFPSAAQQGMGGTGGGGGTGGSGTGGSGTGGIGTGGSGTGGSSMTGSGGSPDDPGAVCSFAEHAECPDRCPMFATCFVTGSGGSGGTGGSGAQDSRLYYRVEEQRFECDGLNCDSAVKQLGDYCCERGEFAPSKDGGGCVLGPGGVAAGGSASESSAPWLGMSLGLCACAFGLYRRRRART